MGGTSAIVVTLLIEGTNRPVGFSLTLLLDDGINPLEDVSLDSRVRVEDVSFVPGREEWVISDRNTTVTIPSRLVINPIQGIVYWWAINCVVICKSSQFFLHEGAVCSTAVYYRASEVAIDEYVIGKCSTLNSIKLAVNKQASSAVTRSGNSHVIVPQYCSCQKVRALLAEHFRIAWSEGSAHIASGCYTVDFLPSRTLVKGRLRASQIAGCRLYLDGSVKLQPGPPVRAIECVHRSSRYSIVVSLVRVRLDVVRQQFHCLGRVRPVSAGCDGFQGRDAGCDVGWLVGIGQLLGSHLEHICQIVAGQCVNLFALLVGLARRDHPAPHDGGKGDNRYADQGKARIDLRSQRKPGFRAKEQRHEAAKQGNADQDGRHKCCAPPERFVLPKGPLRSGYLVIVRVRHAHPMPPEWPHGSRAVRVSSSDAFGAAA